MSPEALAEPARLPIVDDELVDTVTELQRSARELRLAHEKTVDRLMRSLERRSAETRDHVGRMAGYCALLARELGLDAERRGLICAASRMHDIGKVGVRDSILLKPGPLTPEERRVMERHAEIGHEILAGSGSELLDLAATIALTHHEKFDGSGYPRRLAGREIPLEGRIAGVADVFDALTTDRVYRTALPLEEALRIMAGNRGAHFDPDVLDAFLGALGDVRALLPG